MLTFKEIRQASGMNQTQFSKYFEIPYRTIQDWEHGKRKCPEDLLKLMQYKIVKEKLSDSLDYDETTDNLMQHAEIHYRLANLAAMKARMKEHEEFKKKMNAKNKKEGNQA
jgi:transcriptional regulator with XRE-family HTH domain